jgi:hypothetical protein
MEEKQQLIRDFYDARARRDWPAVPSCSPPT